MNEEKAQVFKLIPSPTFSPRRTVSEILHDELEEPFLEHYKLTWPQWKNVKVRSYNAMLIKYEILKRSKTARKYGISKRLCLPSDNVADTLGSNYRSSVKSVSQFIAPDSYTKEENTVNERPR